MKKLALSLILVLTAIISFAACNNKKTLEITSPDIVKYEIGTEKLDLSGGKVSIKQKGEVLETADLTEDMLSTYSLSTIGKQDIKVTYKGLSSSFEIEVEAKKNYIQVTKLPYKTVYGPTAVSENLVLLGGEITAYYVDGTVDIIPLSDNRITATLNISSLKVEIEFEQMKCYYSITEDIDEVGYLGTTSLPSRIKYRKDATKVDVDLNGLAFDFYLSGIFLNNRSYDNQSYNPWITIKEINTTEKYIVYQYDLSSIGPDYADAMSEGYFEIETTESWPIEIEVENVPDLTKYHLSDVGELSKVDLTGGSVSVKYNKGAAQTIDMTDLRISVVGFVLDPLNHQKGIIEIRYQDEIATSDIITCIFGIEEIEGHTDETYFMYCVDQLRDFTLGLDYDNYPQMPQRLQTLATDAFGLFLNNPLIVENRDNLESEKTIITRAVFYINYREFVLGVEEYARYFDELCQDMTKIEGFKSFYQTLKQKTTEFIDMFDDPMFGDITIAENSMHKINTLIQIALADLGVEDNLVIPSAIKAVEIYDSFENINTPTTISEVQSIIANPEYKSIIENAYTQITELYDEEDNKSIIAQLLQYWREDIIYLIMEYYYDSSNDEQPQISKLNEIGVYPNIVDRTVDTIFNLMDCLYESEGMLYIYYYREFMAMQQVIADKNFIYKSAQFVYNNTAVQVRFNPASVPEGIVDPNETATVWVFSTADIKRIAQAVYRPMADGFLDRLFENSDFVEYFDLYTSMLKDYNIDENLLFGEGFDEKFEKLARLFSKFDVADQYNISIGADLHIGVGVSMFQIISYEYYFERINDDQFELYEKTWFLNNWRGSMLSMGVKPSGVGSIKDYIARVEDGYLDLYNRLKDDTGFDDLFGYMLDDCIETYHEFKKIPQDLYNVIIYMTETNIFLDYSKNAKDSYYGVLFINNYNQLLTEIEIWKEVMQKTQSEFDNYKFLGLTINQHLDDLTNKYNYHFGQFKDDLFFNAFYKSARQFVIKSSRDDYIGIGGAFTSDMEELLGLFPIQGQNPTIEETLYRISLIEKTQSMFGVLLEEYCYQAQMQPQEIKVGIALFMNYYQYLMITNAQELDLSQQDLSKIEEGFIESFESIIPRYEELDRISSEFFELQFDKLYDILLELYNQIQA